MQLLIAVLSFAKLALLAGLLALGGAGVTTYRAQTGGGMPAESELSEVSGTLVDGRIVTVERKRKGITTTRQYFEVDLSQASGGATQKFRIDEESTNRIQLNAALKKKAVLKYDPSDANMVYSMKVEGQNVVSYQAIAQRAQRAAENEARLNASPKVWFWGVLLTVAGALGLLAQRLLLKRLRS